MSSSIFSDAPSAPPLTHTGTSLLKRFVAFSTYDVFHDEGSPSMTWEDVRCHRARPSCRGARGTLKHLPAFSSSKENLNFHLAPKFVSALASQSVKSAWPMTRKFTLVSVSVPQSLFVVVERGAAHVGGGFPAPARRRTSSSSRWTRWTTLREAFHRDGIVILDGVLAGSRAGEFPRASLARAHLPMHPPRERHPHGGVAFGASHVASQVAAARHRGGPAGRGRALVLASIIARVGGRARRPARSRRVGAP